MADSVHLNINSLLNSYSNGHYQIDNFPNVIIFHFSVFPKFTPQLFFLYLLPPIILEAAYCLHNEHFFDNIRSILFFAVVGTLINFVLTGGLLIFVKVERKIASFVLSRTTNFSYTFQTIGLVDIGNSVSIVEILVFASLIRKD